MAMEIYGLEGEDQSLSDNKIYAEVFNKEEKIVLERLLTI